MASQRWRSKMGASQPAFDPMGTFKVPAVERGSAAPQERGVASRGDGAAFADRTDLLVVGNGIAGCIAAMETRQHAPDARILVVTEQNHPTINTPALKQFGAGRIELEQLLAYAPGAEQQLGIGVIHQRVARLDPANHRAHLADGRAITYRSALLATGARATPLPASMPGRDFDGVLTLHTLSDYLDLRRRLPTTSAAVVIGGGYHAAETAMLLRRHRLKVTWLIRGRSLLPRQLDPAASDLLLRQVRRHGVEVRLETEVAGIVGRMGIVAGVVTQDNSFTPCELVVAAIGAQPDIELAKHTAITAHSGVGMLVNDHLQTSARDVYAAGAAAAILDPQTATYDARGQWYFAVQQGRLAAAAITGARISESAATAAVGNFWHATQFDKLSVLAAGAPMLTELEHPHNEVLTNGSGSFYRRIVVRHGHLVGYLAVGANLAGGMGIKRLIDERIDIEEIKRDLVTEDFDVRSFFTQRRLHALSTGEVAAIPRSIETRTEQILISPRFQSA
ncbi:MAG TPA: FAD-dependent oxidoreductase [Ktedonobacterales bacterium]